MSKVRSLLFSWLCLYSHVLGDWIGTAGVPLYSPLNSKKYALGAVTVWDLPIAVANLLLFSLSRTSKHTVLIVAAYLTFMISYLKFKRSRLSIAAEYFKDRHLYSSEDYWIHPWACFPKTFSLVRKSDGEVIETVSTGVIQQGASNYPPKENIGDSVAVRKMYVKSRALKIDSACSGMVNVTFWILNFLLWYRRK